MKSDQLVADTPTFATHNTHNRQTYRGADKSLAPSGRKQATATEDFDVHVSYLLS
jgi:hypothetical protein